MIKLTTEQISQFHGQGYLSLPPLVDDGELAQLRDIFDRLLAPPDGGGKGVFYDLTGDDPDAGLTKESVPQLLHPCHHAPELSRGGAWSAALDIAEQLLDLGHHHRDDLIVRDHAIVKPPGSTGTTPWHQDEAYWEEDLSYQELSVWIALQPTTAKMGCMQFIPESHKGQVLSHHSWNNDPNIIALEVDDGQVDTARGVPCPLPAGGATVHHARLLHYTTGNASTEPRRAFILTIGTQPTKLDTPRDFYWNRRERHFKDHIGNE